MDFTESDQHDVFISYAHADNTLFFGAKKGLVTTFAFNLEILLSRKLARNATIWMDHRELTGNKPLTPAIMDALNNTTVIVVIVSTGYLASEWCRKEREQFLKVIKERTSAGSRVFRVELDKIDRSLLPPEFNDTIGYQLWVENWDDKTTRPLGFPNPLEEEYCKVLNRIATHLSDEIKQLEHASSPSPGLGANGNGNGASPQPAVFLAEVTDDLDAKRNEVKDYLEQAGFKVLPEAWRAYDDLSAFEAAIDRDLAQCTVFAQLLSDVPGKKPFNQPYGLPRLQYERATKRNGLKILQWRNNGKLELENISDPDHAELIDGPAVRAESIEDFKRAVAAAAVPVPTEERPRSGNKFVFVSADIADRARAEALIDNCLEKRGLSYAMLPNSNDPAFTRRFMEASLADCDAALVIYCATDQASVLGQVLQCRRIINQRQPIPAIAVYDGPPPPELRDELCFGFPNLHLLDCRKDEEALERFLDTL
jgi:hypothetical protein